MSKFKIGDRVIGNALANGKYLFTREGWQGRVVEINDNGTIRVQSPNGKGARFLASAECFDLVQDRHKIIVTVDDRTITAKLFNGKELVKSAIAKCSPQDEFVFETGATLALDRLLDREQKAPKFNKAYLVNGRFGRMSCGKWFVVVGDSFIYEDGGYDRLDYADNNGQLSFYRIDCIVEACSFNDAKKVVKNENNLRHPVWSLPGAKFE